MRHGTLIFSRRDFRFVAFLRRKAEFYSFIHILRIMRLSVKEVELKIREHEKSRFFKIFVQL